MPKPAKVDNNWPPDYTTVFAWRQKQLRLLRKDPAMMVGAREFYKNNFSAFINDWMVTYDPRNASGDVPSYMPFITFARQNDLIEFILACLNGSEGGLIEKCRDMGATWLCSAVSVCLWLFWDGASIGWGSRKQELVDRLGDPDSIFEKMRMLIDGLPPDFWPAGFVPKTHMTFMRIINPENGATITGEVGDNIGRGGRKLIYFKDESAHYERPEKIEAALADNTNVQIDISSVNGLGNVFHRRREAGTEWAGGEAHKGVTNIFVMDWRDHPAKTQAWYDARKKKAQADGLLHVFAQEVERNYSASVEGVIIPAEWVSAAIDAHTKLGFDDEGGWVAALDVADGGGDKNAYAARKGVVLKELDVWAAADTGETARKAVDMSRGKPDIEVNYDCIGVGAGVKSETNRLKTEGDMPAGINFVPWNAGDAVLNPDKHVIKNADGTDDKNSPTNKDFYHNIKAQGWWELRLRFQRTYRAINEGVKFSPDDMISLPADLPHLKTLQKELSQPTAGQSARMKMLIEKTPSGTRSPNLADAVMMAYWPMPRNISMWDVT